MKLPELKKRFIKYSVRVVAGVLTVGMIGTGMAYTARAAKDGKNSANTVETESTEERDDSLKSLLGEVEVETKEIGKQETVYLLSNSDGSVYQTIVSDHLINKDKAQTLEDRSNLKDIENVKGDETFTQDGNKLVWQANGEDIYYQGTTDMEAPVSQTVTYYLDGTQIAPEDLAGKSGHVAIQFDYKNNTAFSEKVNGETCNVVVPFAAMTAVMLDDSFTNIQTSSNGRIENMASGSLVIGYALPGVIDSLQAEEGFFSEDLDVPESFTVEADVENFELTTAMTAVVNAGSLTDVNSDVDMSEIDEMINTLSDASVQLEDGSKQLAEGLDTLKASLGTFSDGMTTLNKGITDYTDGASKIASGIETLNGKLPELTSGIDQLNTGITAIYDNMKALVSGANDLNDGVKALKTGVDTMGVQIAAAIESASALRAQEAQIGQVFDGMKAYGITAENYEAGVDAVVGAAVTGEVNSAENTAKIIAAVTAAVYENAGITAEDYAGLETAANTKAAIDAAATTADKQFIAGQVMYSKLEEGSAEKTYVDGQIASLVPTIMANDASLTVDQAKAQATKTVLTALASDTDKYNAVYNTLAGYSANKTAIDSAITEHVAAEKTKLISENTASKGDALKNDSLKAVYAAYLADTNATSATSFIAGYSAGSTTALSTVAAGATQLSDGVDKLLAGSEKLSGGISKLNQEAVVPVYDGFQKLNASIPNLTDGVKQLSDGSKTLVANNDKLTSGSKQLVDGTAQIVSGVDQLEDGSNKLYEGMVQFNDEGIERIVNAYRGDIKPLSNKIQAMIDASNDYQTFTDIAEGVNGNVKFVYKLSSISQ